MRIGFWRAKTKKASEITEGRFPVDRLPAVTDEFFLVGTGANMEERAVSAAGGGLSPYGDGSDGVVTIDANTNLERDMFYETLTVNSNKTLSTKGYRIFVKGTLTNNGTIENSGGNGDNGVASAETAGGTACSAGSLGGGPTGGDGQEGNTENGSPGSDNSPSLGGAGGVGGDSSSATGGVAGTVTAPTAGKGGFRAIPLAVILKEIESTVAKIAGGGSGGGGANETFASGAGGGGGGAGGTLFIAGKTIDNGSGIIRAHGGNGGNGVAATDCGGGGGGGGGLLVLIYNSLTAGTETANGGTGGNAGGGGTSTNGANGSNGTVIKIVNI